jgi:hypothetical protein
LEGFLMMGVSSLYTPARSRHNFRKNGAAQ